MYEIMQVCMYSKWIYASMYVYKNACMQLGMYWNMQLYNDASMYVYKYENKRVGKKVSIKMPEYMYAIMKVFMY